MGEDITKIDYRNACIWPACLRVYTSMYLCIWLHVFVCMCVFSPNVEIVTVEIVLLFIDADTGGWINIKMTSYQYKKSHCGDKTILQPSYLHNGISYTGKTTSLYWIGALVFYLLWNVIHIDNRSISIGRVTLAAVSGTSILLPSL